jgi:histidine triad (HIT) family protein
VPTESCVFCQIVNNEVDASIVYRDEQAVAFRDIHPAAPTHILIIPTQHVASLNQLRAGRDSVLEHLFAIALKVVGQEGLQQGGYRLVINTGDDGGQTVDHLHLHLLGGRRMHWPPG